MEAAAPLPGIDVVWVSGPPRVRADVHVAVIDVPAIMAFRIASSGELGHQSLNRALVRQIIITYLLVPGAPDGHRLSYVGFGI
jgi:hypothetical protein